MIAFSTDSSVAGRGVYLLSFLPESDVNRIVEYSAGIGKRSFAALLPDNAYGNVVEAAFKQAVGRKGGRIVAFEKYGADRAGRGAHRGAGARFGGRAVHRRRRQFGGGDGRRADRGRREFAEHPAARHRACGTIRGSSRARRLQGGLYAAPDPSGFRAFSGRYRTKYGADPVRTATLAYDAVALVAALARTQGRSGFRRRC